MAGNEIYSLRSGNKYYALTACSVLFLVVLIMVYSPENSEQKLQIKAPSPVHYDTSDSAFPISRQLLSDADKKTYKQIFRAQKSSDWKLADELISGLHDDLLMGDVLAERYLHRHYDTTAAEIIFWLKKYSDYSQNSEMINLLSHKYPETFASLPKVEIKKLNGYGDSNRDDVRFDSNIPAKKLWKYGLESWRSGKKADAAKFFSNLADNQTGLSPWQSSAASFWAYRSYDSLGNSQKANEYLEKSAQNPRVFYGILARKQLNQSLELDTKSIEISNDEIKELISKPKIQRIIALAQSGLNERAETQLRNLFPSATKQEKWGLLFIASQLNLASAQISMAKQLDSSERGLDTLKYPIPEWQPEGGFRVDPSIIYALMRQESGFHSAAKSSGGAMGLMQLMPKTAEKMKNSDIITTQITDSISEPVLNITLGERYVEHLLNSAPINGNLLYMLAAYNAGIGRLRDWQNSISYNDDPLLFVESIPYSETRYYVMQVMTNYWIYSELAGTPSNSIFSLLKNTWPTYALNEQ